MSIPSFEDMVRMKLVLNALLGIHRSTYNILKLHLAIQAQAAGLNYAPNQVANNPPQPDVGHLQVHVPSDIEDADDEEKEAG